MATHAAVIDPTSKGDCTVQKDGVNFILSIPYNHHVCIEPNVPDRRSMPGKFDLEYDFVLEDNDATITINFCSNPQKDKYCSDLIYFLKYNENKGLILDQYGWHQVVKRQDATYPKKYNFTSWHHLRITFGGHEIKCFVDQYRLLYTQDANYTPRNFSLCLSNRLKLANFRISYSDSIPDFDKILTENKFVTHAILFDVNRSTIKPESLGFIAALADFLEANPSISLEIDGHTDNTGDDAANMTLSKVRADEVKKQLIANGIKGDRLTTRGYGATKPVHPNDTPEGRADNRRVEFIRL